MVVYKQGLEVKLAIFSKCTCDANINAFTHVWLHFRPNHVRYKAWTNLQFSSTSLLHTTDRVLQCRNLFIFTFHFILKLINLHVHLLQLLTQLLNFSLSNCMGIEHYQQLHSINTPQSVQLYSKSYFTLHTNINRSVIFTNSAATISGSNHI